MEDNNPVAHVCDLEFEKKNVPTTTATAAAAVILPPPPSLLISKTLHY